MGSGKRAASPVKSGTLRMCPHNRNESLRDSSSQHPYKWDWSNPLRIFVLHWKELGTLQCTLAILKLDHSKNTNSLITQEVIKRHLGSPQRPS
jgi:hypothetical protein